MRFSNDSPFSPDGPQNIIIVVIRVVFQELPDTVVVGLH
jgi:hypothetical protein